MPQAPTGAPAAELTVIPPGSRKELSIEQPIGTTLIILDIAANGDVETAAILLTTRKLLDGTVFAP